MARSLLNAKGSSAIPMTPFDAAERIDVPALEREIEFICQAGVGSICSPVMVSEFMALSEEERKLMIRIPLEVADGRTAFIANVAACNINTAVEYAEYAEKCGADAVIAMAPWAGDVDSDGIEKYFRAIAAATTLPVMIQNAGLPNVAMSASQVMRLCEEVENISWVKEEVPPGPVSIDNLKQLRTPALEGIMSGFAGAYAPLDIAGGATATIHACEFCDVVQREWDLFLNGNEAEARKLHYAMMPAIQLELLYGMRFCKEIMIRRGIFTNANMRNKCKPLSQAAMYEIDRVWEWTKPLLLI